MHDQGGTAVMESKTMPVRLAVEAIREAKLAAATKGMSLTEYASKVLLEAARRDNDEWARLRGQAKRTRRSKSDEGEGGDE